MQQKDDKKKEELWPQQLSNPEKRYLGKKAEEYLREGGKIEDYPNETKKSEE